MLYATTEQAYLVVRTLVDVRFAACWTMKTSGFTGVDAATVGHVGSSAYSVRRVARHAERLRSTSVFAR
jgi:hypothetical protein